MTHTDFRQVALASQKQFDTVFPVVLEPGSATLDLASTVERIRHNREYLLDLLGIHGAVLLRNFPISSDTDFDAVVKAFELANFTYAESLSNAVRKNRTERVFTANEAPPEVEIFLHHEMAQTPIYPSRLLFFCEQAADSGGATPLCRSDVLLSRLDAALPEFTAACRRLGARYTNVMPAAADIASGQGRSWQDTLSVATAADAEARLRALGYSFEWLRDGSLRVTTATLPVVRTLADGREVFFNQLIAAFCGWQDARNVARKSITFGDGSEIPVAAMEQVVRLSQELVFDTPWQTGDVALVDNFLVMHGRRPFQGTRRVLASLAK
jgi:alpha-ketoglutarate-dependent taurine dioxygenase